MKLLGLESLTREQQFSAQLLAYKMVEISTECWRAGWARNLEYHLWARVSGHCPTPLRFGQGSLTAELIAELAELANRAGVWIVFTQMGEACMPLPAWKARYDAYRGRSGAASASSQTA